RRSEVHDRLRIKTVRCQHHTQSSPGIGRSRSAAHRGLGRRDQRFHGRVGVRQVHVGKARKSRLPPLPNGKNSSGCQQRQQETNCRRPNGERRTHDELRNKPKKSVVRSQKPRCCFL